MNTPSEYFTLYPCAGRTHTYTFSIDALTPVRAMTKRELAPPTWPPSSTSSALCPTPRTGQNRRQRHPTMPSSPKPHNMLYLCRGIEIATLNENEKNK